MEDEVFVSNPILSLQSLLREISFYDDEITDVIPDGIFGERTKTAVMDFQKKNNMEQTGEVNYETWKRIVESNRQTRRKHNPPRDIAIYPSAEFVINPYDQMAEVIIIQVIMNSIAEQFTNIPKNEMSGVHDETSMNTVKVFQKIFNMEESGIINKIFWDYLTGLYEVSVTRKFMLDN